MTDPTAAIRAQRARSNDAIAARDPDGVTALMTDTVTVAVAGGPVLRGRAANRTAFAEQLADPAFRGYVRTPADVTLDATGLHATEQGHWEGRWQTRAGPLVQRGTYLATWTLTPVGWCIAAETFVPGRG